MNISLLPLLLLLSSASTSSPEGALPFVEYLSSQGEGREELYLRLTLVEEEWEGRMVRFIELWHDREGKRASRLSLEEPRLAFIKLGSAIFRMEGEELAQSSDGLAALERMKGAGRCSGGAGRGSGRRWIETKAGRFRASKVVLGKGRDRIEGWFSADVPLMGLVLSKDGRGRRLELLGYGSRGGCSAFPKGFEAPPLPGSKRGRA